MRPLTARDRPYRWSVHPVGIETWEGSIWLEVTTGLSADSHHVVEKTFAGWVDRFECHKSVINSECHFILRRLQIAIKHCIQATSRVIYEWQRVRESNPCTSLERDVS